MSRTNVPPLNDAEWKRALCGLALCLEPGGALRRTWPLLGGLSAHMTVLEIARPGEADLRAVLRIPSQPLLARHPGAAGDEFRTVQALFRTGVRVPEPLLLDESRTLLPVPYLVLDYVEGKPDCDPPDRHAYERQRAEQLARIHTVDTSEPELATLRRRGHAFASGLRDRTVDPTSRLDESRIIETLQPFWAAKSRNIPVLLHGDLWPGNLLWTDGTVAAVLDWEDASLGEPLADLAICRLDSLLIFGRQAMETFTDRYLSLSQVNTEQLPYWDLCAALRAAPSIGDWAAAFPLFDRPDITEERLRAALEEFTEAALGRIDPRTAG